MDLKSKQICRFCLTTNRPLTNIYNANTREVPLCLQIVASVGIEVFASDKMPSTICEYCISIMDFFYQFKQMCREADAALRIVPTTKIWPMALDIPLFPADSPFAIIEKYEMAADDAGQVVEILDEMYMPDIEDSQPVLISAQDERDVDEELEITSNDDSSITVSLPIKVVKKHVVAKKSSPKGKYSEASSNTAAAIPSSPTENIVLSNLRIKKEPKVLNQVAAKSKKMKIPQLMRNKNGNVDILLEDKPDIVRTDVFACPHCDRSFPLEQLLDIHVRNHTRERESSCSLCSKKFFTKYDLAKHMTVHTQERPHICVVCNRSFSRTTLLQRHYKTHKDEPRLECNDCDRFFFSQPELDAHAVKHEKPRKFKCSFCPKSFAFKQGLERHEVVHSESQPFPCTYCEASFNTKNKLQRHLHQHAGGRPFPCKYCPKSYMMSHHLSRHVRSHAVLEDVTVSFKCNCCPEEFKRMEDLVEHMQVHESTSDPSCPLCHEQFESGEDCQAHIQLHLEGDQFACEFCDLLFVDELMLQEHSINDHAEENRLYDEELEDTVDEKFQPTNEDTSSSQMELNAAPPTKTIPAKKVYGNKSKKTAEAVNVKVEAEEGHSTAESKKRTRESMEVPQQAKIANILNSLPSTVSVKKFKVAAQATQPNKDVNKNKSVLVRSSREANVVKAAK